MAWTAVRTMLFSGCCAVRVEPAVWVWKRSMQRARIFCVEALAHDAGPEAARGAEFGDLFDEVVVRVEEEREARGEAVDIETGVDGGLDVRHAIRQGEGDLLRGGGAGLAHVVAGDGDGVPLGDFGGGPGEHVGDDAHGVGHRIDVGPARDVLLEDVVLHGAAELAYVGAASLCRCARRARAGSRRWR